MLRAVLFAASLGGAAAQNCPGGSLAKCIAGCPASPTGVHDACVQACGDQCPAAPPTPPPPPPPPPPACPGGSLQKCIEGCPASPPAVREACVTACGNQCPAGDRYHCDINSNKCQMAAKGHSTLQLCQEACLPPGPVPTLPPLPSNCSAPVDFVFLIDGSNSIHDQEWKLDKEATQAIADAFKFDCTKGASMGVIQFTGDKGLLTPATRVEQPLTCDKAAFDASVTGMVQWGGYTATGDALAAAQTMLAGGRAGAQKFVVLITDGVPDTQGFPNDMCNSDCEIRKAQQVSNQLISNGVIIMAIGVGRVKKSFLDSIASTPSSKYVVNPSNWPTLISELQQIVTTVCPTPAPLVPTPVPTPAPPLNAAPCIRFGNTLPFSNTVDVTITQTTPASGKSHTFSNYKFGQFSQWVSMFEIGKGTVTVKESGGATLIEVLDVPLTPGPLVIVTKCAQIPGGCTWPPTSSDLGANVESIAASFMPIRSGSAARLFNLSPDTKKAGLKLGVNDTDMLIDEEVTFGLGSDWVMVPDGAGEWTATENGAPIATVSYAPDRAPAGLGVFTQWLVGAHNQTGQFAVQLLPLADAPEEGRCNPTFN